MNSNDINIIGGKQYGSPGAKGYVIDIFKPIDDDKDKKYFTYGLGLYKTIFTKSDEQQSVESDEQPAIILDKIKTHLDDNGINNYLIKIYDNKEYYETEKALVKQLIQDGLIEDYIYYNGKKIIGFEKKNFKNKIIYGLIKKKCDLTLNKFIIINKCEYDLICKQNTDTEREEKKEKCCTKENMGLYRLRDVMKDILNNIITLQDKNYVHCDIKADNIMICDGKAKLIDWDLAIKNVNFNKDTICKNRYHGSGTHQSPLITKYLYTLCNKSAIIQKIAMSTSQLLKRRNIPTDHNKININTYKYFKDIIFMNDELNEIGQNLIKYHIDLYSVSHVLYELCGNQKNYKKIIENKDNDFINFISILQNTYEVENKIFYYKDNNLTDKNINLDDLLKKLSNNLYIIEKKVINEKINNLQIYKKKYMKYKQKYLNIKTILENQI